MTKVKNNKVALMYDFDLTLSLSYMQEFTLLPSLDYSSADFWTVCGDYCLAHNMDKMLSYMYAILSLSKQKNIPINYAEMKKQGEKITFFQGVETWFDRINEYGKSLGLQVEHYIISSGLKELIEGTSIAKYFKRIFACSFAYDENNNAFWPSQIVNYTTKTQYIYRIRKNFIDKLYDDKEVNLFLDDDQKLPYEHMIYFGDGETDIACMQLISDKGGNSICVYSPENENCRTTAYKLFDEKRANFVAKADYRAGERLDIIVKTLLNNISTKLQLKELKTDKNGN